jgi:hypothetical protein
MPAFGVLSCDTSKAPHLWHNSTVIRSVPLGEDGAHEFAVYGPRAVGTVIVTAAPPDQTNVTYALTVRATHATELAWTTWRVDGTSAILAMSGNIDQRSCIRYDIMMRVPPGASLSLELDALAHVHLAGGRELRSLEAALYSREPKNLLVVHEDLQANNIALRASGGYIVGGVSVAQHTLIDSEDGTAILNLDVFPNAPHANSSGPAIFTTKSSSSRSDIRYHASAPHRPLSSRHSASHKGHLYLNYTDASFNGVLNVDAGRTSMHNINYDSNTRYAGDRNGEDRLEVHTGGWVGLYVWWRLYG